MTGHEVVDMRPKDHALVGVFRSDHLDLDNIEELLSEVLLAAADEPSKSVVLDMSNLRHIASLGLGTLYDLHRHLKEEGQELILTGLKPQIRAAFEIAVSSHAETV
jgi:anti-sigma B factor antagonist